MNLKQILLHITNASNLGLLRCVCKKANALKIYNKLSGCLTKNKMNATQSELNDLVLELKQKYRQGTCSGHYCVLPVQVPTKYAPHTSDSLPSAEAFGQGIRLWNFAEQKQYLKFLDCQEVLEIDNCIVLAGSCVGGCNKIGRQVCYGCEDCFWCAECFKNADVVKSEYKRCSGFFVYASISCDVCGRLCADHMFYDRQQDCDVCNICAYQPLGRHMIDIRAISPQPPVISEADFDGLHFGSLLDWVIFATFGDPLPDERRAHAIQNSQNRPVRLNSPSSPNSPSSSHDLQSTTFLESATCAIVDEVLASGLQVDSLDPQEPPDPLPDKTQTNSIQKSQKKQKKQKNRTIQKRPAASIVARVLHKDETSQMNRRILQDLLMNRRISQAMQKSREEVQDVELSVLDVNSILVNQNPCAKYFGRFALRILDDKGTASYYLLDDLNDLMDYVNSTRCFVHQQTTEFVVDVLELYARHKEIYACSDAHTRILNQVHQVTQRTTAVSHQHLGDST